MTAICPHCGYDLKADEPGTIGRISYDPRMGVKVDGYRVGMAPQCHSILVALIRAEGRTLNHDILAERVGYEGDANSIVVQICRIRAALRAVGMPEVIKTVRSKGFYFDARGADGAHREALAA